MKWFHTYQYLVVLNSLSGVTPVFTAVRTELTAVVVGTAHAGVTRHRTGCGDHVPVDIVSRGVFEPDYR